MSCLGVTVLFPSVPHYSYLVAVGPFAKITHIRTGPMAELKRRIASSGHGPCLDDASVKLRSNYGFLDLKVTYGSPE